MSASKAAVSPSISAAACLEPLARAARERHPRALARERRGDPAADPLAGAHHQRDAAVDPEVHARDATPVDGIGSGCDAGGRPLRADHRGGRRDLRRAPGPPRPARQGRLGAGTFTATPEAAELSRAAHLQRRRRSRRWSASPTRAAIPRPTTPSATAAGSRSSCAGTAARPTSSPPPRPPSSPARPRSSSSCCGCAAPTPRPASPTWRSSAPSSPRTPRRSRRSRRSLMERAAARASPPPPTSRRTPSTSSTPTASAPGSATAGCPRRASSGIADDEARERGRDYLYDGARRAARAPGRVAFELQLQLAAADDPLDDPTALWPDERELRRRRPARDHRASSTIPSATATSTSSTRPGSSTGSSSPTTRSCTRGRRPTRSPPTGAGTGRRAPYLSDLTCSRTSSARAGFGMIGVVVVMVADARRSPCCSAPARQPDRRPDRDLRARLRVHRRCCFYLQRRDVDRAEERMQRGAPRGRRAGRRPDHGRRRCRCSPALATGRSTTRAIAAATRAHLGDRARSSISSGAVMMVLIACAVIPWQLSAGQ